MSSDLISRQALKNVLTNWQMAYAENGKDVERFDTLGVVIDIVEQMPNAEPKKGKWIDEPVYKQTMDGKTWDGFTYCSECKGRLEYGYRSKFCPYCGAKMDEDEDIPMDYFENGGK